MALVLGPQAEFQSFLNESLPLAIPRLSIGLGSKAPGLLPNELLQLFPRIFNGLCSRNPSRIPSEL